MPVLMDGPCEPFTITMVVENVSNFADGQWASSPSLVQRNVPWTFAIEKEKDNCNLILSCMDGQGEDDWSIDVKWWMSVIRTDGKIFTVSGDGRCDSWSSSLRANNILSWEDLLAEYVVENEVIVEVEVSIVEMDGIEQPTKLIDFQDEKVGENADVVLIVKNEPFFLTKQILALQSPHFHSLFYEGQEEPRATVFTLDDVEPKHFQNFLEVLHHEPALNDDTIQQVLKLCKEFKATNIARQCEEFLIYKSRLCNKKKLQLVVRFDLFELKNHIINNFKSAAEVRAALYPNMKNPFILNDLLEKTLALRVTD